MPTRYSPLATPYPLSCVRLAHRQLYMDSPPHSYRVFIIRCWEEADPQHPARFLLEIPRTGERYGFITAEQLLLALRPQLNLPPVESEMRGIQGNSGEL